MANITEYDGIWLIYFRDEIRVLKIFKDEIRVLKFI